MSTHNILNEIGPIVSEKKSDKHLTSLIEPAEQKITQSRYLKCVLDRLQYRPTYGNRNELNHCYIPPCVTFVCHHI